MERSEYLDLLAAESAALLDAARRGDPAAPVPGCPDWTLSDLVWHVGEVHDFWRYVVAQRPAPPDGYADPVRPDTADGVIQWAATRAAALEAALRDADPAAAVWTWASADDVAWVVRRMAHETAFHRFDAEAARGVDHRLDPVLAADGVDEFLTYFLGAPTPDGPEPSPIGGSVHLHCTDADGEWTVVDAPGGGFRVTREHAKGDVALRGKAHDLLAVLWRRRPLDVVDVFGDDAIATSFLAAASTD